MWRSHESRDNGKERVQNILQESHFFIQQTTKAAAIEWRKRNNRGWIKVFNGLR
jgi:hypothetical protein